MKLRSEKATFLKLETGTVLNDTLKGMWFLLLIPVAVIGYKIFSINRLSLTTVNLVIVQFVIFYIVSRYTYNFFMYEREDSAYEYMFSLPISKWKIFYWKILPRLIAIFIVLSLQLLLGNLILSMETISNNIFFDPLFLYAFIFLFFFGCLSFSLFFTMELSGGPWIISLITFLILQKMVRTGIDTLNLEFDQKTKVIISVLISMCFIVMMLMASFINIFRKLDCKPMRFYKKRFAILIRPPMMVIILFGIILFIKFVIL
ncbi:MAG: hypothetical protein JW737_08715 [Acidobacteria bacterium]|nr:hypothetical protein [Acidobacteriota bacterium]